MRLDLTTALEGGRSWTAREFWLALAGGFLLACAVFWPLPVVLDTDIAKDAGDPLLQAWQLAWGGHALLHEPLDVWQSNAFFPTEDSLAYSDSLLGYAPLSIVGDGFAAALVRYNVIYLLVYGMTFAGAYILARELGIGPAGAIVAGVAFAYSPWRWSQAGHMHIISSGTIALCLALLLRGYRRQSPRYVVGGFLVAAWQLLIGVSLGLMLLYLLATLAAFALVVWWRRGRPAIPRRIVRATATGAAVVAGVAVFVGLPYLDVQHDHPQAKRSLDTVHALSPPLLSFVTAQPDNVLYGSATQKFRDRLPQWGEQTLIPGVLTVGLAAIGLLSGPLSRRMRLGLLAAGALAFVFSMGTRIFDGRLTYRLLYDYAPGWDGVRTPGRLHTLTTLVLAMLAAAGAQWLIVRLRRGVSPRGARAVAVAGVATLALAAGGILLEGSHFRSNVAGAGRFSGHTHPRLMPPPRGLDQAREPLMLLPADRELYAMLWSVDGFPRIVNGYSGLEPDRTADLRAKSLAFPDPVSVQALRAAGVRTVVAVVPTIAASPWAPVLQRPLDPALGISKRSVGDVVLFEL